MKVFLCQHPIGLGLRWLIFLPIGYLAIGILEVIPLWLWSTFSVPIGELTLLKLLVGIVLVGITLTAAWWYLIAAFFIPRLCCNIIAPTHKVASIIFATLLTYHLASWILFKFHAVPWGLILVECILYILLLLGSISAYFEENYST